METGSNVSNLLAQQGAAQAGGELGQARAYGQILNIPAQMAGMRAGGGFGGGGGGGLMGELAGYGVF
jgi:hypothetical protein